MKEKLINILKQTSPGPPPFPDAEYNYQTGRWHHRTFGDTSPKFSHKYATEHANSLVRDAEIHSEGLAEKKGSGKQRLQYAKIQSHNMGIHSQILDTHMRAQKDAAEKTKIGNSKMQLIEAKKKLDKEIANYENEMKKADWKETQIGVMPPEKGMGGIHVKPKWINVHVIEAKKGISEEETDGMNPKEKLPLAKRELDKLKACLGIKKDMPISKPFAGYKDFDDCVKQNQHAKDPEAYCATIERAVQGNNKKN